MPIDNKTFKEEMTNLVNALNQGFYLGGNGQYDEAIESLTYAITSAERLMQIDPEIGEILKLDRTLLLAKGYQLKAYLQKMEAEPENEEQILQEMEKIAQGDISFENSHFKEITDAVDKWIATNEKGGSYKGPIEE